MLIGDMVVQTANNPGTGTFNLIGAPAGRSSFLSQCGAGQVYYFAEDAGSWEKGIGTLVAGSPDTLSRGTVLGNSLGTTAPINFAGAVTIICDIPAERSMWADETGALWNGQGRVLANFGKANIGTDVPRLDQLGMQQIGQRITIGTTSGYPVGTVNIIFYLPVGAGFGRFRVEWEHASPVTAGGFIIFRTSADGTNFFSGSADYLQQTLSVFTSTVSSSVGDYDYVGVTPALVVGQPCMGSIEMCAQSDHGYELRVRGQSPGTWFSSTSNGRVAPSPDVEHLAVLLA